MAKEVYVFSLTKYLLYQKKLFGKRYTAALYKTYKKDLHFLNGKKLSPAGKVLLGYASNVVLLEEHQIL